MSCGGGNSKFTPLLQKNIELYLLNPLIDKNNFEVLNSNHEMLSNLKSISDEQIIINMKFIAPVKIFQLMIYAPVNQRSPKIVKIYVNQENMNFDDCENVKQTQKVECKTGGGEFITKGVKYSNVKSLTLFFQTNFGDQFTQVNEIQILGTPLHETNMKNLKKSG